MFHVNPTTGDVGKCSAKKACPFGGPETHFTSPEAARAAYEAHQSGNFQRPKNYEEKFPYVLENIPGVENISVNASGKRADGAYPKLFFKVRPDGTKIYGPRRELLAYLEQNGITAESRGVSRPEDILSINDSYVREPAPLVAPDAPKKPTRVKTPKVKSYASPNSDAEFKEAILAMVPEPNKSKVAKPPVVSDHEGYLGGVRYIGALALRSDENGRSVYISQTEASAGIRKLVADAKKVGELPKWLNISVRKNSGAWVTSINVEIGYKPEDSKKVKAIPQEWLENNKDAANRLKNYVSLLARQYEYSDINSSVDYHHSSNAGRVVWRSAWAD